MNLPFIDLPSREAGRWDLPDPCSVYDDLPNLRDLQNAINQYEELLLALNAQYEELLLALNAQYEKKFTTINQILKRFKDNLSSLQSIEAADHDMERSATK